ncbi:SHOCT domain-containing protein [Halosolutus halophilus]|uniref:SHOCT domain-containing protein n=1 Tax=Halosolutus halophilus TaxID=1552990 RepID=UPI00223522A2|nr:SHOCT domain-containing protein [Halosolutus halophilus]
MKLTIPISPVGRVWIVGLLTLGVGLVAAGTVIPWYWLLPAFIGGVGAMWILGEGGSTPRSGDSSDGLDASTDGEAALATLKQQYAVGKIDDAEFERRLETLMENETIADVERRRDVEAEVTDEIERAPDPARENPPNRHECRRRGKRHHGRR